MASIDPLAGMARLSALLRQTANQPGAAPSGNPSAAMNAGQSDAATATLRQQLRSISQDHPQRRRALARIVVESLLVDAFGPALTNDVPFQAIVDDVLNAMHCNSAAAADLDRLTEQLLAPSS